MMAKPTNSRPPARRSAALAIDETARKVRGILRGAVMHLDTGARQTAPQLRTIVGLLGGAVSELTHAADAAAVQDAALAVLDGETSLGDALRECFPDASGGDETPEMAAALESALVRYIQDWADLNAAGGRP